MGDNGEQRADTCGIARIQHQPRGQGGDIGRGGSGGKWGDAFCSGRGMEVEDAEQGGWTGLDVVAEGQQGGLGRAEAGWRGDDV